MKETVLVTGGAGFIGSHTCQALIKSGLRVRILDNFSTGSLKNLRDLIRRSGEYVDIVEGDLRDSRSLSRAMLGASYVIHLAAQISVQRSLSDPQETEEINTLGTLALLREAQKHGIKGLAFASSAAVYGNTEVLPIQEPAAKNPISPYGTSKLAGENYCSFFRDAYGVPTVSFRFFNVFGPRQRADSAYASVIPKFLDCVTHGKSPTIFGDGEQTRDFIYVEDVAKALVTAVLNAKDLSGPYNLCTGSRTTLNELLASLASIAQKEIVPIYTEAREGDIRASQGDPTAYVTALEKIGLVFRPTSLREGLKRIWEESLLSQQRPTITRRIPPLAFPVMGRV